MIDTNRPVCGAAVTAPDARMRCMHAIAGSHCAAQPGTCQHQRDTVRQPAGGGLQVVQPPKGGA